jgi:hypothetical protein
MLLLLVYIKFYIFLTYFLRGEGAYFQAPLQRWLTGDWNSNQDYTSNQRAHLTIQPILPSTRKLAATGANATVKELKPIELPSLLMETITLQLSSEDGIAVTYYGVHVTEDSWYGTEQGGGVGSIHLVRPKGSRHLEGLAITNKGEVFTISTQPTDGSIFVYDSKNSDSPISQLYLGVSHETIQDHSSSHRRMLLPSSPGPGPHKPDTIEVDLMILYTKRAMCAHAYVDYDHCETKGPEGHKNREAIEAEAMLNFLITNVALQQSNSKVRLNLVHVGLDEYDYGKYENFMPDMNGDDFREILEHLLIEDNKDAHRLRDRVGADIVALIVDKNYQDYGNDSTNGKSGDVYDTATSGNLCNADEQSFDASTDTCPGRAYVVASRNGRHHFVFTHEISHMFFGDFHNNVCNSVSNVAPYYAPCFQTITTLRGGCGPCKDPYGNIIVDDFTPIDDKVDDYSFGGVALIPRIPLFTGPGVKYSTYPLEVTGRCPRSSVDLTDAACFDFNGPTVAAFRKKKGPRHAIKITFAFAFVTVCALVGVATKKRRQVLSEQDVAAEVYVAERQFDMVSMDKKAHLAGVQHLSYTAAIPPLSVYLAGGS